MKPSTTIDIDGNPVGPGHPCFIIGEVAQSHDGSLGMAHAFVDAVASAGADAIKFQTHLASEESTEREQWRVKFSYQDASRFDYWRRMEFSEAEWRGLAEHAREGGIVMLSSPFSPAAVEMLSRIGMPAWKVASGEVGNLPMLRLMAGAKGPILLSTGMNSLDEIDAAVSAIQCQGSSYAIFQTTSAYPTPPEKIGLNLIQVLRERHGCPVGLSDHSGTIYPGIAGTMEGVNLLEVHVALSREMFGPDVSSSVTTTELRQLVEGIRFLERALANPVDKDAFARELEPLRTTFFKSIVARRDLAAGSRLGVDDLAFKKPGDGLSPERLEELLGRSLKTAVPRDHPISLDDVE